jgi:hypothetical protein
MICPLKQNNPSVVSVCPGTQIKTNIIIKKIEMKIINNNIINNKNSHSLGVEDGHPVVSVCPGTQIKTNIIIKKIEMKIIK